jgi:serine/threonine-protein kinase
LLGAWIVFGSASIHTTLLALAVGPESGFAYYIITLAGGAHVFLRVYPRHMAAMTLLALACAAVLIISSGSPPWFTLDETAIDVLRAGNLAAATACMMVFAFVIIQLNRRTQRELARLREEVIEARQLGQYTLGDKIGEGGMGEVYRATHALLRRPAAIKLLREANETAMRRFEREVQLTSELTHPNTIAIFDYGRTPEGLFYYVMEYLEGLSLKALVDQYGPQPPERVVHILEQVCESLEEAHAHGLVHRDIKPANIILCERGMRPDSVKVLDFGLVKDLSAQDATAQDVVAGTPAYLSPEALADPEAIGPSTDLYAVGAVGYFLLTGEEVFERKSLVEILRAQLLDPPIPPHERLGAPVPEVLESLIMGCLDKDPVNRPQSAAALRRALDAVELPHPWTENEARIWWTNHRRKEPVGEVAAEATIVDESRVRGLTVQVDVDARSVD